METFRIELILLDEEGNKIQATVKNTCVKNHEKSLGQDICLCISEFGVTDNDAKDTFVVKHPYKINFYRTTRLKKHDDFSDLIGDITSRGKIERQEEKGGKLKRFIRIEMQDTMLLENLGGEALDHQIVPLVKYNIYDISQDFLVKLQKVNLAYIRDIIETVDKKDSDSGELKKQVVFVCSNKECGEVTNVRYKVASKLLNRTAEEFIREMIKNGDMDNFPEHFNILLGCTYAFKVDITKYCLDNHKYVYPQLLLPSNSEQSLSSFLSPPTMGKLKGAMSGPGESSSFSYAEDSNDTPPLKRSVEVIDVEDTSDLGRPPLNDISKYVHVLPKCRGRPPLNDMSNDVQNNMTPLPSSSTQINHLSSDETTNTSRRNTNKGKSVANFDIPRMNLNDSDEDANDSGIDDMFYGTSIEYLDHGDPTVTCGACGAVLWAAKARLKRSFRGTYFYSSCCFYGKVMLPKRKDAPQALLDLYRNNDSRSKNFLKNIRTYNMMFSFTSMGGKFDHSVNRGNAPYCFRLHGQNYHNHGSLLPPESSTPKFAQLYIYDTENEVQSRIFGLRSGSKKNNTSSSDSIDSQIITDISSILVADNELVKSYRMVRDRHKLDQLQNVRLRLIGRRQSDGREYNLPTASEVAALIVGDIAQSLDERDIIIETKLGNMQRINVLHPSFLSLQYPLLFPYGEDNYRTDILHRDVIDPNTKKHVRLTMMEYMSYLIQERPNQFSLIHHARRLFQQFFNLASHIDKGETDGSSTGRRIIVLSSSFTGGSRYMRQNYLDAMSLVKWFGHQDFFITFTCNPKWPEIKRFSKKTGLRAEDRPDMLCKLFKIKLDHLVKSLKENQIFRKIEAERTSTDSDGYPVYKRRDDGKFVEKSGVKLDNKFVVGYNSFLLKKYQAHINVEYCNQAESIKYLFKYINKGPDIVTAICTDNNQTENTNDDEVVDEIKDYYYCRYLSACEACWRIFGNEVHYRFLAVERLPFHLPGQQQVVYEADADIIDAIDKPSRKRGFAVGKIHYVPPSVGEAYYLRVLLHKQKGPEGWDKIKKVNDIVHRTYRDACYAMGLLDDDREYIDAIEEANSWACGEYVRKVFARLLTSNTISRPDHVWNETWGLMCDDIEYEQRKLLNYPELELRDTHLNNLCLKSIDSILRTNGSSLDSFPGMPLPDMEFIRNHTNILIHNELCYNKDKLVTEHETLFLNLTTEQKNVYTKVLTAVEKKAGGDFFVYGYGGTGKTYVWRTLSAALCSKGEIILNVASSGIASLLLSGGRTAHSRFVIPINVNEESFCLIKPGSDLAALLEKTSLIIWDEATMMHKHCFESLNRTFRDILGSKNKKAHDIPFRGKFIVFGGDFRQILPVIPGGTRSDVVHAALNSSYLWNHCEVLRLTVNMRLQGGAGYSRDVNEIKDFADWILNIGDGKLGGPNDGEAIIDIPDDLLIKDSHDPVGSLVQSVYPSILDNLNDPTYFQERAILAPTHDVVEVINDHLLDLIPGKEKVYYSSDSICESEGLDDNFHESLYSPDVLNGLKLSGIPNHRLALKVGAPVMLLCNIDQSAGLCNGTRLRITKLGERCIKAEIITRTKVGEKFILTRMKLSPSDKRIPFKINRRQFLISGCFAMTINKSQGQSLSNVGIFLPKPVFTHGKLYVAVSRVKSRKGLKVLMYDKEGKNHAAKETLSSQHKIDLISCFVVTMLK
uniref:ATP-dependent DNA helicase n=1 Tax=Tanacetum cinerariifolium TaxID=118510 RepID=A0A6L2JG98_TANCI|nr:uncharacterized protein [Tanacetum cinerariifolium]